MSRPRRTHRPPLRASHRRARPGHRHRDARGCPGRSRPRTPASRRRRTRSRSPHGDAQKSTPSSPPTRCWCPGRVRRSRSRESAQVRVRVRGRRRLERLERAGDGRGGLLTPDDWTARFVSPRATPHGSPAPLIAGTVGAARRRRQRPAVRHRARRLHPRAQRAAGRRQELAPGWTATSTGCATRPTTSPSWSGPATNALDVLLGNGWYRGRLGFQRPAARCTATGWPCSPSSRSPPPTARSTCSPPTGPGPPGESDVLADDLYDGQRTDLRRTARQTRDAGRRARRRPRACWSRRTGRRSGSPRCCPRVEVTTSPAGKTLVDFGQNLVGRVRLHGPRPGRRATRSSCGTPRCWRTASSASARCAPRRPPTPTSSPARTRSPSSRRSPSTASATPRSPG